jgi:hypothetical protein
MQDEWIESELVKLVVVETERVKIQLKTYLDNLLLTNLLPQFLLILADYLVTIIT